MRKWRWSIGLMGAGLALAFAFVIVMAIAMPAAAAYACPFCFGLKAVGAKLYVDRKPTDPTVAELHDLIDQARLRVRDFYGAFHHEPTLLVCMTEPCDQRLGGKGAKARAYGSTFIHVSPTGVDPTILAHEFSHIETHARIGEVRGAFGGLPAWFDEGLAVIVSRDERYLEVDNGALRCRVEPEDDLPRDRREWGQIAGKKQRPIYAMAACRVLRWMETHGGSEALLALLDDIGDDKAFNDGNEAKADRVLLLWHSVESGKSDDVGPDDVSQKSVRSLARQ